jgi:Resolvase, N terminal domain
MTDKGRGNGTDRLCAGIDGGPHTALQTDALRKAGCERVFEDTVSGAKADRPGLAAALAYLRDGDAVRHYVSGPNLTASPLAQVNVRILTAPNTFAPAWQ